MEDYWEGWVSYRAITADPAVLSWSSEFDEDYNRYLCTDAGTYLTVTEDGSLALTEEPVTAWGIYRWWPDEEDAEPYPGYVIAPVDGDSEPSDSQNSMPLIVIILTYILADADASAAAFR